MNREQKNGRDGKKRRNWTKAVDMILRCCHITIASVLFGGLVWAVPYSRLANWHHLVIATGSALILFNIYRCRHWPYQGRGLMAALHVSLFWLVHARPETMTPVLVTALTVGVIGSHMPAFLRHWSLLHRRVLD